MREERGGVLEEVVVVEEVSVERRVENRVIGGVASKYA